MKGHDSIIRLQETREKGGVSYFNCFSIMECCGVIHTTDAVKICADSMGCYIPTAAQPLALKHIDISSP